MSMFDKPILVFQTDFTYAEGAVSSMYGVVKTVPVVADIFNHGQKVVLVRGGRGGRGNAKFANSILTQNPWFVKIQKQKKKVIFR